MRYIAAYLLLQTGGNATPTQEDITKLLGTVGIEADSDRLSKFLSEIDGKDINGLISEGSSKLASVPSGGAGGAVSSAPAAGGAAPAAEAEAPKEEKKEEKEESDDDMGFGLFD